MREDQGNLTRPWTTVGDESPSQFFLQGFQLFVWLTAMDFATASRNLWDFADGSTVTVQVTKCFVNTLSNRSNS